MIGACQTFTLLITQQQNIRQSRSCCANKLLIAIFRQQSSAEGHGSDILNFVQVEGAVRWLNGSYMSITSSCISRIDRCFTSVCCVRRKWQGTIIGDSGGCGGSYRSSCGGMV
ncbi:unnamed protein product [Ectocarpus sp. CCAP 1310/34]|nr:unnamed protein product [Ectocarpus sp. CCAP 1310/34]